MENITIQQYITRRHKSKLVRYGDLKPVYIRALQYERVEIDGEIIINAPLVRIRARLNEIQSTLDILHAKKDGFNTFATVSVLNNEFVRLTWLEDFYTGKCGAYALRYAEAGQ